MLKRTASVLVLCLTVGVAACEGTTQGYYGPCDEPVGLGAGCDPLDEEAQHFSPADACLKLASCGILNVTTEPDPDAGEDWEDPFDLCVERVQATLGQDPGSLVLVCLEDSTCADLAATELPEGDDPDPNHIDWAEEVIGWCGRLDPQ